MSPRFNMLRSLLVMAGLAACSEPTAPSPADVDAAQPDAPTADAPSTGARVNGAVSRTAQPMGDARGTIYLAIFDRDPVIDRDTAQVIARTVIDNADLSAPNAAVGYLLSNVPVRAEKYYLVAFLDDNASVMDPSAAAPDRGDLVSLDGLASPKVTVATPGDFTVNVTLNTVLPF